MPGSRTAFRVLSVGLGVLGLLGAPPAVPAQGTSGPTVSDSKVGYIDNAIPGNELRLRFDAAYDSNRATRAEFFYAQTAPGGPGLPLREPRVDYQEFSAYAEAALGERFSAFVQVPTRFLNPEVNDDTAGLGDMDAGFKYAFLRDADRTLTLQFRTFAPTGDAHRGLGNRHVSLEPALLLYKPLTDQLRLEGEFRTWVPVGGTDFAGPLVRYGAGLGYELHATEALRVTPVAEFVGWTVLGGKEAVVNPSGLDSVQDAAGDTIVNVKVGTRLDWGNHFGVYAGYGRALTGEVWYKNTLRLEARWSF
jgi:hypothetical protein